MEKKVTLQDIAEKVGVSVVSVSKAISGKKGVSADKRLEILEVAESMGYQKIKRNIDVSTSNSLNIGIVISENYMDEYDSFYLNMYKNLTTAAAMSKNFTLLEILSEEDEFALNMPQLIVESKVDALVIVGKVTNSYMHELTRKITIPLICLDFSYKSDKCECIISDSFYGSYTMTKYLIDLGHRDIAFVGTVLATDSITDRYLGYVKALMYADIDVNMDWVIPDRHPQVGGINFDKYLKLPKKMPTAFVCNNDLTASEVIKRLKQKGYSVPGDVSVVGYDNYIFPGISPIEITSYQVDIDRMVAMTLRKIKERLQGQNTSSKISIIEGHLVEKNSAAPLQKAGEN